MFQIDLKSRKSICDQIVDNIKELIVSGIIGADEKIPSVREMAGELTVNPNTVQKAYRILESQKYIFISPGRGTFACDVKDIPANPADIAEAQTCLRECLNKLYYLGISKKKAADLVSGIMDERSDWK